MNTVPLMAACTHTRMARNPARQLPTNCTAAHSTDARAVDTLETQVETIDNASALPESLKPSAEQNKQKLTCLQFLLRYKSTCPRARAFVISSRSRQHTSCITVDPRSPSPAPSTTTSFANVADGQVALWRTCPSKTTVRCGSGATRSTAGVWAASSAS